MHQSQPAQDLGQRTVVLAAEPSSSPERSLRLLPDMQHRIRREPVVHEPRGLANKVPSGGPASAASRHSTGQAALRHGSIVLRLPGPMKARAIRHRSWPQLLVRRLGRQDHLSGAARLVGAQNVRIRSNSILIRRELSADHIGGDVCVDRLSMVNTLSDAALSSHHRRPSGPAGVCQAGPGSVARHSPAPQPSSQRPGTARSGPVPKPVPHRQGAAHRSPVMAARRTGGPGRPRPDLVAGYTAASGDWR
jgi:hypothetical protein